MIGVLVGISHIAFLRSVEVDVLRNAQFDYDGENGNATLVVYNDADDINQRTANFLSTVEYEVSPNTNLSNGDVVHVHATYDQSIADQYNFKPVNVDTDITVEGLVGRYSKISQIDESYLKDIDAAAQDYIQERKDEIYQLEVNEDATRVQLKNKVIYSAFLKSKTSENSDRMIYLEKLNYTYQGKKTTLYYIICVPGINKSNEIDEQDVYGVKAYMTQDEIDNESYDAFIERIYGSQNEIQKVNID